MYMMILVLDNEALLDDVLAGWRSAGARGSTILESSGAYRHSTVTPIGARYLFGQTAAPGSSAADNLTIFAIVPDEATVERCLQATEAVTGDLSQPDTGVFAAWALSHAKGVPLPGDGVPPTSGGEGAAS